MALKIEGVMDDGVHAQKRHCQLNELSPPSSSLSPDFRAGQQARLAFSDPEPRATDSRSVPRRLKLTMPEGRRALCLTRRNRGGVVGPTGALEGPPSAL